MKKTNAYLPLLIALAFIGGVLAGKLANRSAGPGPGQQKFNTILNLIDRDYVDVVNVDSLLEATLPELLRNLDPHSAYIPASDLEAVNEELDGSFCGVGIQFMINADTITVIEAISGGPSEKVGIMPGDRIVKVDGDNVAGIGITNEQVIKRLRGERDSTVRLGIRRPSAKKTLYFDVTRGDIPVTSIDASYILSPGIGYLKVNKFGRTTYDEFFQSLMDLRFQGAQDFIIDLRGNSGGFMEIAFLMANEFLDKNDVIVTTRGRDYFSTTGIRADGLGSFRDAQVVVLIDEFSASSSEIFAGALQDNDRALIVGRRSFGKGLIQRQTTLPDSSAIRLTIGRYYTPSGRSIQKDYSNLSKYDNDILDRYERGEMFSQDSIHLDTSLTFLTREGRTVYGGGGIMPDVFVPNDTTGVTTYYRNLVNAGMFPRFTFEYADNNRDRLSQASSLSELLALLPPDDQLLYQFVSYAARNGGIPMRWYYINISRQLILSQLKQLIARDILGMNASYEVMNVHDTTVQRALDEMLRGSAAYPIRPTSPADSTYPDPAPDETDPAPDSPD